MAQMFGPLNFEINQDRDKISSCMLCDNSFNFYSQIADYLKHLFDIHRVVIEGVENIKKFDKYNTHWKEKLKKVEVSSVVPVIAVKNTEFKYFVISDLINEDKELRHLLNLEYAMGVQEHERTNLSFKKMCLFCRTEICGTRVDFIKHLSSQHNLQLGKPENLVFIDELISTIEDKLDKLQCIYCEKTFPERNVLKEHMRKKLHKRINPKNNSYDKYYIVNYLEPGKNWESIQKEDDSLPIYLRKPEDPDEEWEDWTEDPQEIICLFCDHKESEITILCEHMKRRHDFDFNEIVRNLDFYQKVKLVNYIRRQIYVLKCVICDEKCDNKDELIKHLDEMKHYKVQDLKLFDQPEYYFPTYENDAFLYYLDEIND